MGKILKKNKEGIIYTSREYPLELRLLQFFVFAEAVWALFNLVMSFVFRLPKQMVQMYAGVAIFLVVYWSVAFYSKYEHIFVRLYFPIYLISLPFIWYFAGGLEASANILFACEIVLFVMCLSGKRQVIYIILSLISSSIISGISRNIPPLELNPMQIAAASRNIGMSTSLLMAALLIKQKVEYARERDAAVKSEKELEKSNQLQKNFLANMSHEIRSPLGIVLGFNDLIADSNNIEQVHEYSANIKKAGKTLHTVINDILDYSKIESGKLDIIDVDYSYKELLKEIKNDIGLKCSEKGLSFVINDDSKIPTYLFGDNIRIKQCLLNILSNAVKYTDQGTVTLNTELLESSKEGYCRLKFEIVDTGRGMREETIPNLFTAFQRLEEGQNRGIEGTGLGLAITKNLMDEMEGQIEVTSEYGKGSTFTLFLDQKISAKAYEPEEVKAEDIDISGLNILAVDDTKMNLTLINKLLVKQGVNATMVDNGKDCIETCKDTKFDVILLDHMMPEMDGIEVFRRLRGEEGANQNTPVIMLTANAMAGANKEYTDMGFSGYVSKPISLKNLKSEICRVLS